ncbi:MAG: iron(III) transport system substrate-binding protein [Alphaproteobacteria bacterium]|jgi:iron(III) transport system substrate-binding protein|nr:iron(III) transport system substrate-binding protein [Alphaproteobacteria bacterium]
MPRIPGPISSLIASLVLALAATSSAAAPSGTIMVYTSQPSDQIAKAVEAFRKSQPGVKVELYRSGTTEVMSKLQAEFAAGRPQADVVLIADAVAMTQLKNDGRLLAYLDAPADKVPPALIDPDKTFFGTKLITTGIVINTNLVKTAPKSWKELLPATAAGKTILPHPLYSGAAVIHIGTMVQQPEFGWRYFETLAKGGAIAGKGNGAVIEAVARGEKAYGIIIEYMAFNARQKGSPVDFVFPQEGVSAITQPVAVLKTSRNAEAAKAFVAWQLSEEAQRQSVAQGYFPIFDDIPPPKGYPPVSALKIMAGDFKAMLASDEDNKRKVLELFGG